MKKISFVLILIMLVLFLPACANTQNPWLDVRANINELSDDNQNILNGAIEYPTEIQNKIYSASPEYYQLNFYANILASCFSMAKAYVSSFAVAPINSQNATMLCNNLNFSLQNFKSEITVFNSAKNYYFNSVKNMNLDSAIAIGQLKVYKQAFYSLILKANEVNKNFLKTYSSLYGGIKTFSNYTSLDVAKAVYFSFSELIDAYISYALTEFKGIHGQATTFYVKLSSLKNRLSYEDYNIYAYSSWLSVYNDFLIEKKLFLNALNFVDLTNEANDVKTLTFKNKIQNFVNYDSGIFIDKTLALINY